MSNLPSNFKAIKKAHRAALDIRAPGGFFMHRSEWVVPTPKVGDTIHVLYAPYLVDDEDAGINDLHFREGDNKVVQVKRNGTVVTANGHAFHKTGYGHAKNNALVMSAKSVHPWNDYQYTTVEREALLDALGDIGKKEYRASKAQA